VLERRIPERRTAVGEAGSCLHNLVSPAGIHVVDPSATKSAGSAARASDAPHPEPVPDIHSSVDFESNGPFGTTQRPESLDASMLIWAVRPTAMPEETVPWQ
jgi:hypothetical protein